MVKSTKVTECTRRFARCVGGDGHKGCEARARGALWGGEACSFLYALFIDTI